MDTSHGNEATTTHPSKTFDSDDRSSPVDDAKVELTSTSGNPAPRHFNPFRDDTDLPASTFPTTSSSSSLPEPATKMDVPATQSPAVQIMERPGDDASPYRIPDYVFQRNKSRAPKEWSTASNESLFSIQMGHMSFTGDLFMYNKSGELGMRESEELSMHRKSGKLAMHESNKSSERGAYYSSSGELGYSKSVDLGWYNLSGELATLRQPTSEARRIMNSTGGPQPQVAANTFVSQGCHGREPSNSGVGATGGVAAETLKDVIRENEQNHNLMESPSLAFGFNSPSAASCLDERSSSTKSFTFPVLTKPDKSQSSSKQISIQPNTQQQQQRQHHPVHQPQAPPTANATSAIANTTQAQMRSSFSCFSCCPLRI